VGVLTPRSSIRCEFVVIGVAAPVAVRFTLGEGASTLGANASTLGGGERGCMSKDGMETGASA
jgi:hypothetical protein